jgi:hypothetical protein
MLVWVKEKERRIPRARTTVETVVHWQALFMGLVCHCRSSWTLRSILSNNNKNKIIPSRTRDANVSRAHSGGGCSGSCGGGRLGVISQRDEVKKKDDST